MRSTRARLAVCVLAVLVCQGASLLAAPVALCRGALSADADLDACCKDLKPGQTCPMHHKTHGAVTGRAPAWACVCSPSDAAMASMLGVSGTLPRPSILAAAIAPVALVAPPSSSTIERQQPPTSPPPRAWPGDRFQTATMNEE